MQSGCLSVLQTFLIIILALSSSGTKPVQPTFESAPPPVGGKIAFVSDRDGNWEIYTMNSDGTDQKRLTFNPTNDSDPAWSPNGKQIAFASDREVMSKIFVMDADGTNIRRVSKGDDPDFQPSWSPDGKQFVFSSMRDREGASTIYLMDIDGSNVKALFDFSGYALHPQFSPDGRYIVFYNYPGRTSYVLIRDVTTDPSSPELAQWGTKDDYEQMVTSRGPTWSPDGQHIAYSSNRPCHGQDYGYVLYIADRFFSNGNGECITDNSLGQISSVSWAPDSKYLAINCQIDNHTSEICVVDITGTKRYRLTANEIEDIDPAWQPIPNAAH